MKEAAEKGKRIVMEKSELLDSLDRYSGGIEPRPVLGHPATWPHR